MIATTIRSLVPLIRVANVPRSIAFYESLGFSVRDSFAASGSEEPRWASLNGGGAELMIGLGDEQRAPDDAERPVLLYLYCDDVEAMHSDLSAKGLNVGPIGKPFYNTGGEFRVTDPDGYPILIC